MKRRRCARAQAHWATEVVCNLFKNFVGNTPYAMCMMSVTVFLALRWYYTNKCRKTARGVDHSFIAGASRKSAEPPSYTGTKSGRLRM